jgi:hypothetical protein
MSPDLKDIDTVDLQVVKVQKHDGLEDALG